MTERYPPDDPHIHDLAALLKLLQEAEEQVPDSVKEAGKLSRFAVFTRYPGIARPVTREEYEEKLSP